MKDWYNKYLSVYGVPFEDVPDSTIDIIKRGIAQKQNENPLISIVVIAYNEERRLLACLWSLSEIQTDFPIELIGVNNNSQDKTERVYQSLELPYYNEPRQSPGYARQCGLLHSKGKYHFCIDADTIYPPKYIDLMMDKLFMPDVSCVSSLWSFYPDDRHSKIGLFCFELIRDVFLYIQHFKRPELCVRGMVFAFKTEYARHLQIRTDIRRGEDGSLAFLLKKYGRIAFLYNRKARPITGYGTLSNASLLKALGERIKIQGRGLSRVFYEVDHYIDSEDNIIKK